MKKIFDCHSHTMYSNLRLLDCINQPKHLIDKAIELGLGGIAITDHECLSAHMEVNQYAKKLREKHPDFTIALGNEIYLTDDRSNGQKYYHFILIAKDAIGHKGLYELSTIAWKNLYVDRKMERVPLLKSELATVMSKYKGHIIATTACLGGELSSEALAMQLAENVGDTNTAYQHHEKIVEFVNFCLEIFGDDFYIECAPATSDEQVMVNRKLYKIAKAFNIGMTFGTDAHYLTIQDRPIHKAYLNSKDGDREVDSFYEFAHLMDYDELHNMLMYSFNDENIVEEIFNTSAEIKDKIEFYSLEKKQIIPKVEVENYEKSLSYFGVNNSYKDELDTRWPLIKQLCLSDNIQERYWVNECLNGLVEKELWNEEYLDRIETEADVIQYIGQKLEDCLFAYFNTFKHYIDLFWECGSIVGPGRGSATGFLSNYLLGITQLDPIRWHLPFWRFLNKERAELPSLMLILGSCKKRTLTVA